MTVHFAGFESKRILGHYYSTVRSSRYCFRLMLWKSYNSDGNWWIIIATCYSFSLSLNMSFLEGKKSERWGTVAQNRLMKSQSYSQISWEVFFFTEWILNGYRLYRVKGSIWEQRSCFPLFGKEDMILIIIKMWPCIFKNHPKVRFSLKTVVN